MKDADTNQVVVKRNELIRMGYSLTLNEQRLLLACISQVDSRSLLEKEQEFSVHIQEIKSLFSNTTEKNLYRDIKTAAEKLFDRRIVIKDEKGNKTLLRWVWKVEYVGDAGLVKLNFSPDVIIYLSEITKNFTKYKLSEISGFSSQYSIRIYELMSQWQTFGEVEYSVDELRGMLDLGDKYKFFSEFRRNVIDKSVNEINKFSSMKLSYGVRKVGRTVQSIQFKFEMKSTKKTKQLDQNSIPMKIQQFVDENVNLTIGKSEREIIEMMRKRDIKV